MSRIIDHDVRRNGTTILLGVALQDAVLDIVTDEEHLRQCITLLQESHDGLAEASMGEFGIYPVALRPSSGEVAVIMVDGPYFEVSRNQSAGIWVNKDELLRLLLDVVDGR